MKCVVSLSLGRHRRAVRAVGIVLVALAAYGCEGDDSPSDSSGATPTSPSGPHTVSWDQLAPTLQVVNSYSFTAVIDGSPASRLAASCSATSTAGSFTCSAPIPTLPAGAHTLAVITTDANGASSPVSNSVSFTVPSTSRSTTSSMTALAESAVLNLASLCMGDGPARTCYQLNRTATNLTTPTDPTEMPDGRILVLDNGVPLEIGQGGARPVAADISRGSRITDISVASDSQTTREVFALEVTETPRARMVDVVRFRDVGGVLGERAVVVPGIRLPNEGDAALLADKELLVAVPREGDGGSGPGLILRYDRSGRPAGRSIASPALAWGPGRPTALMPMGDKLAAAGVAPGPFAFGALTADGTTPVSTPVTQALTASGGVRAVARHGQLVLFAAGDGSAYVGGTNANGEATSLQKVDTRGAAVTGITTTRRGTVVATAQLRIDGLLVGRVYELAPLPASSAR